MNIEQGFRRDELTVLCGEIPADIAKGSEPSVPHKITLGHRPHGSGFWLHYVREVIRNGGKVMLTSTESDSTEAQIKLWEQSVAEQPGKIESEPNPVHLSQDWIDSIREVNPELVSETASIDEKRWKEILPTLGQPRKGGKYAKGKATKRKLRHRKGK